MTDTTPAAHPAPGRWSLPQGVLKVIGTSGISTIGTLAMNVALGLLVYDITGRELDLGLIGLAEFLPTALLAPIVGPIADRYDRRKVVSVALLLEAVAALGLALYTRTGPTRVWPIFALIVGFGIARAAVAPALRALPADLSGDQLARVVPLSSAAWQLAVIVGPVVGGFLYVVGPQWPFYLAVVLATVGAGLILWAPDPRKLEEHHTRVTARPPGTTQDAGRGALREAVEGLAFVRRTPILLGAISLDLFAVLFGGAVALLPAVADQRLGVGAVGLGWLRAAGGMGAGATTLLLAWRPVQRRVGRVLLIAVAVFGVGTLALAFTRTYAVAFLAMAVLSGADAISVFIRATLVPLVTPPQMRGRVLATENVFIGASNELGAFESGVAGQLFGVVGAIASGGVATLLIVFIWWWRFPALRDVDRFSDVIAGRPDPHAPRDPPDPHDPHDPPDPPDPPDGVARPEHRNVGEIVGSADG
ncbi:MAG: MFS transporter [Acidimicrobiales bacterium]